MDIKDKFWFKWFQNLQLVYVKVKNPLCPCKTLYNETLIGKEYKISLLYKPDFIK